MKKIYCLALLVLTFATPNLRAITNPATEMEAFRAAVSDALYNATNGILAPDKKAVAALKKAIATIDKTVVTNISADTKTLSTLIGALARSSVSNDLSGAMNNVMEYFFFLAEDNAYASSNRLNNAFPSGTRTAAARNIALVYTLLNFQTDNYPAIAKAISTATKKLAVADKLVNKSLAVQAPPAQISGKTAGAVSKSFKTFGAVILAYPNNVFIVNGAANPSTHGFIQVAFTLGGVPPGTSTVPVTFYDFVIAQLGPGGRSFVKASRPDGTAQVTYNPATKSMFGTFTFTAEDEDDASAVITVTGSFNGITSP